MRTLRLGAVLLIALMLGTVACTPSSTPSNSGTKATMSSSELENRVKSKIESDAPLKAANISVNANADRNEATLSGTVNSESLRARAVELAKSANPGLSVTDKIEVKPGEMARGDYTEQMAREEREKAKSRGESVGDKLEDGWIHTKIVAKLLGNSKTPQSKINVDVVNNEVTLRGTVNSPEQKAEAERIAKDTDGVKAVKNMLKVASS